MNKKQILNWPPCEAPVRGRFAINMRCGSGKLLAKTQIILVGEKEVLNIDLFREDMTGKTGGILAGRYFAERDTGSYKALVRKSTGEMIWKKIILDNVARMITRGCIMPGGNYWYRARDWEYDTEKDSKTAWKYLGESVGQWENNMNSNRYYREQYRKQSRISVMMQKEMPDIPEDFGDWIAETVFPREYLFIEKPKKENGMYRCFCSSCGSSWRTKKISEIGYTSCRRCGGKVLATRKEAETSREEQVYLFQPCKTDSYTWVERAFKVRAMWKTGQKTKCIGIDEQIRILIPQKGCWGVPFYEVGVDRNGQRLFWIRNTNVRKMKAGYIYDRNREQIDSFWCDEMKHSGIWMLANTERINANNMIIHAKSRPYMEYLIKGRFIRLAKEIARGSYDESAYIHKGHTPEEVLGISNDRVDRLRRMDGGFVALSWLQKEEGTSKKISQENLEYAEEKGIKANNPIVTEMQGRMGSANTVINYIRKQCGMHRKTAGEVMETWRDYMRMAEQQGLNIAHEIFYKPKDIYKAHDACVKEGQKKETMKRAKEILARYPDVEKVLQKIRTTYTYEGEQYCVVVPGTVVDIIHEGRALGHCIDTTDRYFDRMEQEISYIVFLRRKESRDVPWYTLEIEPGGTVRQQRTTGNEQNKEDAKSYMPFLREWQKVVRARISEEDRALAERSRQTRIMEYEQLRAQKEKVRRGKLAGKLLADVLEADLIESIV